MIMEIIIYLQHRTVTKCIKEASINNLVEREGGRGRPGDAEGGRTGYGAVWYIMQAPIESAKFFTQLPVGLLPVNSSCYMAP